MKRRNFLRLTLGSLGAAAVPAPIMARAAAPAAATGSGYAWAVAMAKSQGTVSAEVLARRIHIPLSRANTLMTQLLERGVITQPNALGVSRAIVPVFQSNGMPVTTTVRAGKAARSHIRGSVRTLKIDPNLAKAAENPPSTRGQQDSRSRPIECEAALPPETHPVRSTPQRPYNSPTAQNAPAHAA